MMAQWPSNKSKHTGFLSEQLLATNLLKKAVKAHQECNFDLADKLYREIISYDAKHADALNLFGLLNFQIGEYELSVQLIATAIKYKPAISSYYFNLANSLVKLNEDKTAILLYQKAIELTPDYVDAYNNLGNCLLAAKENQSAINCFESAININPNDCRLYNNLGNCYFALEKYDKCIMCYENAIEFSPNYIDAHFNLGNTLSMLGRWRGAIRCFDQVLKMNRGHGDAHYNKALELLLHGDYKQGWREYEWRFRKKNPIRISQVNLPAWQGESLSEKNILILAEQGLGDQILFAKFISLLLYKAKQCYIECDFRLFELFKRSFPAAKIIAKQKDESNTLANVSIDYHIAIASIPQHYIVSTDDIPDNFQYLLAKQKLINSFKKKYDKLLGNKKIGFAWYTSNQAYNKSVSVDLPELLPLFFMKDVGFLNLQYGEMKLIADDFAAANNLSIYSDNELDVDNNLEQLAAAISVMDVIVTVDNIVAVLAAALNKTVYVLLSEKPHFIWGHDSSICDWFTNCKLIRKQKNQEWREVIANLADKIIKERINLWEK